ncbi:hypothetical protein Pmani_001517 [Petrolisthes manimaculis]|uniref:Reverse transcriptase n=1 Tax=Petrolisthes manimaculis TaxID=1843537 RepID=A0AAE1QJB6_9EUCA|nr:hypothetical protein Pmani_001517 [Petrolisthes manimaculis]
MKDNIAKRTVERQFKPGDLVLAFLPIPKKPLQKHDVELVSSARSIKQHPFRVSPWKREALRKEVQFLMDHGLVEKSDSEWASPCLLVDKPEGSFRMCTDYRQVNQ